MTRDEGPVDLTALIDNQRLGGFHIRILLVCGLCCFAAGFFAVALGFIAPVATTAMKLPAGALGPAFAAMGVGSILGSFSCTPLADRFGRKPVIIGGLLFAVPFLFLTATVKSLGALMAWQFLAGFGLMGTIPIVLALAGEFMPKHSRVTLTMLVWIGFNIGSIVTGVVAARLASGGDWRSIFLLSGVLALLVTPLAALGLSESLDFLAERHSDGRRIAATLRRLAPNLSFPKGTSFVLEEKEEKGFPVSLLFDEGRARLTVSLWLMFLSNIAALVFINSWLATLLTNVGIGESLAIAAVAGTNAGGIIGGIVISELCDRFENVRFYVLAAAFLVGGLFIALIGYAGARAGLAFGAAFMTGFFTFGSQNTANAVAATIYPTAMRSTGAGWAIGVGNSAQVFSPLLGGYLLSLHWPSGTVIELVALPTVIAAIAALLIAHSAHRHSIAIGGDERARRQA